MSETWEYLLLALVFTVVPVTIAYFVVRWWEGQRGR